MEPHLPTTHLQAALPTWRYRILSRLVSPLILSHLIWRTLRDGGRRYFKQRLGFFSGSDKTARIHIHAASVGEVITVLPLIESLQGQESPESNELSLAFLVTTNTPTGASILDKHLSGNAIHAYLPLDFAGATKRFYSSLNISNVWLVETEIWPWLFARAQQNKIPLAIINARLSDKSNNALADFFAATYRRALANVTIFARSKTDASRFEQRGAQAKNISVLGNLKFAHRAQVEQQKALLDRPYVLAASTHDDEEISLAKAWLTNSSNTLMVIAPRHAERGTRLIKQLTELQQTLRPELPVPARRSAGQIPSTDCKLYLADTLGELEHWYSSASAAFVGGSLIERGGHNVLEPARLGTPVIVGAHTFNFKDEITLLNTVNGIKIVQTAEQVTELLVQSTAPNNTLTKMGYRASLIVNEQQDVIKNYHHSLLNLIQ